MDLRKFSGFILLAGMAVFLYGLFVLVTNQPNRSVPNTGNVFKDINQSIDNIGDNFNRQTQREDGKKKMVIGGIILFVGISVRLSSKSGQSDVIESTIPPKTSSRIQHRLNLPALFGGLLIFISIILPFSEWYVVANGPSTSMLTYPYNYFTNIFNDIYYYNIRMESGMISEPLIVSVLQNVVISLIFIGGGVTAFCAFTKYKKTVLISSLTGLFGFSLVTLELLSPLPDEIHSSFIFGFYVFTAGVICLLISTGKAFFDRKEITN